ncbi:hypothetical protein TERTU_1033 [Teredinibacter turnerae T7901]|uniref:Uncharacterized protein n=1 Tax=Teredinibacter turnerae (strain ATCC 39867 / T7901) TaxID=377629 RepID=C5BQW6_TERTT|nr:hypothetical protein TERTU_1033 [Teredinibacter turnerae T7901]
MAGGIVFDDVIRAEEISEYQKGVYHTDEDGAGINGFGGYNWCRHGDYLQDFLLFLWSVAGWYANAKARL